MSSPQAFIISRTFNAPLARMWKAWTQPEPMAQWWGPKGFKADVRTLDLRPGGIFHYRTESPKGQEMWGRMVFRKVVPNERLVFINSFSDETGGLARHPLHEAQPLQMHTTITFAEQDGKTTVTVRWEPQEASPSEVQTFDQGLEGTVPGSHGVLCQGPGRQDPGDDDVCHMPSDQPTSPETRDLIAHARMAIGDELLMASDAPAEHFEKMQGFFVALHIKEPAEAERVYNALAEGGTVMMPLGETFCAQKFAMLKDRFGTPWMINCEKPKAIGEAQ